MSLWDHMGYSPPGSCSSSVHRIFQAGMLDWIAISCSMASFQTRDRTQVSYFVGKLTSELLGKPIMLLGHLHNASCIPELVWNMGVHFPLSPSFLFISYQLRFRKRLTISLAYTRAPACRTGATCPTWMLWSIWSCDTLMWSPPIFPMQWPGTLNSELPHPQGNTSFSYTDLIGFIVPIYIVWAQPSMNTRWEK